jgi:hypothetical protein
MFVVLRFLLSPDKCFHSFIETFFEEGHFGTKEACGDYCSFWNGEVGEMMGVFKKRALLSLLTTEFEIDFKPPHWRRFLSMLGKQKPLLWGDKVPKHMAAVHALVLQLIARQIIAIDTSENTKIGTDDFADKHVILHSRHQRIQTDWP